MSESTQENMFSKRYLRVGALSFLALMVLLVSGYFAYIRFDFKPLYSNLDIEDASLIAAELERQEIRYRVGDSGESILVPGSEIDAVRLAVYSSDGPAQGLTGFELFNESEMGLTDFAQKIKFQRAIQGELSRTIMMMDNVRKARVHIAIPERSVFRSQRADAKAAVTLIAKDGGDFNEQSILGIQRVVASSVPGLSLKHVTVVNGHGNIISKISEIIEPLELEEAPGFVGRSRAEPDDMYQVAALVAPSEQISRTVAATPTPKLKDGDVEAIMDGNEPGTDENPYSQLAEMNVEATTGASVSKEMPNIETPTRSEPDIQIKTTANAATIRKDLPWWPFPITTIFAVLLVLGIMLFRKRNGLTVDQRTAFAAELSEALQVSKAEVAHG